MNLYCDAPDGSSLDCNGLPSPRSIHELGLTEAQCHKWIESEKAGRDLGADAIRSWIRQHWNGFLRHRWLEHLEGRAYWIELNQADFGLLQRMFPGSPLFNQIFAKLRAGQENLEVVNWAIDTQVPMDDVVNILVTFDVNSRRIECNLEANL